MTGVVKSAVRGRVIWHDPSMLPEVGPELFDPDRLRAGGLLTGGSTGRHTAWFLRHGGRDMVLRHYWRGGLVGRVVRDLFLRVPAPASRAMREFGLLNWMHGQGLPVPRAVAAQFRPAGLLYRADLLMERIADAVPLADRLAGAPLEPGMWQEVGRVIARMHGAGVHHSDLNCRNILLDRGGKVWLIDFDKCGRRADGAWKSANLDRLKRSLLKEKGKVPGLNWGESDWQALLEGYRAGASG
ncbi:MAG: 3-deoxy-D-manno-octulosonic acid kinase [Gemmobacter sp.]